MNMTRREFSKSVSSALAAAGLGGCATVAQKPRPEFMWGNLVHFGMNCWSDVPLDRWGSRTDRLSVDSHVPVDLERLL